MRLMTHLPNRIKCFFLEPTDRQRLFLRRYSAFGKPGEARACPLRPGEYSCHDIMVPIGECPVVTDERGYIESSDHLTPAHDDPRWPSRCACGSQFGIDDEWQLFTDRLYTRLDTGEEVTLREAPAGALWFATWMEYYEGEQKGPDGHILMCRTPGGDWCIDSRSSNCGRRDDDLHRCWVRHGNPRTGLVHVDKNGNTCAAGAGSILFGSYHGFLRNGFLEEC